MQKVREMGYEDNDEESSSELEPSSLLDDKNNEMMKKIEEECKIEAEMDAALLKQRIEDEIKQVIGDEEISQVKNGKK